MDGCEEIRLSDSKAIGYRLLDCWRRVVGFVGYGLVLKKTTDLRVLIVAPFSIEHLSLSIMHVFRHLRFPK